MQIPAFRPGRNAAASLHNPLYSNMSAIDKRTLESPPSGREDVNSVSSKRLRLAAAQSLLRGYCTGKPKTERAVVTFATARSALGEKGPAGSGIRHERDAEGQPPPGVQGSSPCLEHLAARTEMLLLITKLTA